MSLAEWTERFLRALLLNWNGAFAVGSFFILTVPAFLIRGRLRRRINLDLLDRIQQAALIIWAVIVIPWAFYTAITLPPPLVDVYTSEYRVKPTDDIIQVHLSASLPSITVTLPMTGFVTGKVIRVIDADGNGFKFREYHSKVVAENSTIDDLPDIPLTEMYDDKSFTWTGSRWKF